MTSKVPVNPLFLLKDGGGGIKALYGKIAIKAEVVSVSMEKKCNLN